MILKMTREKSNAFKKTFENLNSFETTLKMLKTMQIY